jgi:hypothetical protein
MRSRALRPEPALMAGRPRWVGTNSVDWLSIVSPVPLPQAPQLGKD